MCQVLDAARGMLYLHTRQPPLVHRDLKSPNLLVDEHYRVKAREACAVGVALHASLLATVGVIPAWVRRRLSFSLTLLLPSLGPNCFLGWVQEHAAPIAFSPLRSVLPLTHPRTLLLQVGDFNLSRLQLDSLHSSTNTHGGPSNPRWLAPEVFEGRSPNAACDVYAFAVVMWEVLTWQIPFGNESQWKVWWGGGGRRLLV